MAVDPGIVINPLQLKRQVEHFFVGLVVQVRQLVREPSDGVGFCRTGGVLDEVVASRPVGPHMDHGCGGMIYRRMRELMEMPRLCHRLEFPDFMTQPLRRHLEL